MNEQRLASAKQEFQNKAVVFKSDAAEPSATAIAETVASIGPLDGLWLNAAYATLGSPEEVVASEFDRMMATNVRGPMLQLAALSPYLAERAFIVITSSSSTYEGAAATGLYAATKGPVAAMARSWASALAPRGTRVNTLVPGPIETNFRSFLPEEARKGFGSFVVDQVPLARVGTPEEASAVALFLLSSDSSYVTESQYAVAGGLIMR